MSIREQTRGREAAPSGRRAASPGESTTLELPDSSRTRIGAQQGIDLLGVSAEHRWPKLRSAKAIVDFSKPDAVARKFSCTLFVDLAAGRASVTEGPSRLHVEFDATRIPHFESAWASGGRLRRGSQLTATIAPGSCARPERGVGAWNGAQGGAPGYCRSGRLLSREYLEMSSGQMRMRTEDREIE